MTKNEIIQYIINTPENSNPNVLRSMLDELPAGGDSNFELSTLTLKVLDGSIYLTGHVLVNDALSMDIYYQSGTHLVEVVLYKHLGIFYLYNQTS